MANSKISVENLNLHYGENHALKDVNMEIADHAITAFIGPSGCGKSTFLRCLNRMNDLVDGCRVEGKVILDGEDIYDKRVDTTLLRKKVGMVFQQCAGTIPPAGTLLQSRTANGIGHPGTLFFQSNIPLLPSAGQRLRSPVLRYRAVPLPIP